MRKLFLLFNLLLFLSHSNLFAETKISLRCNSSEKSGIQYLDTKTKFFVNQLIDKVEKSLELKKYNVQTTSNLERAKIILTCIKNKIPETRYSCLENNQSVCREKGVAAYAGGSLIPDLFRMTLKGERANKVHFCPFFWESSNSFQFGALIHEVSHVCGTSDAAYFGSHGEWMGSPRDVKNTSWADIADTYSYWVRYGFCIPGVSCK